MGRRSTRSCSANAMTQTTPCTTTFHVCAFTYLFTGKERDAESGLDYFGARYYASSMGRFTSTDPNFESARKADPQTWNRYTYGLNNPLRFIDPTGELWQQNMNGGWDWGTWCPITATCRTEFAQQEGNNTVVYGPSSAKDKQSFAANSSATSTLRTLQQPTARILGSNRARRLPTRAPKRRPIFITAP
jgi:RHS repeat-associated protein